ncbi:3620_t:CDS:2 [Entrophospora sp. SA101]|nr:3620_t:CDS:2 [Entrophospora sp. SA101]
MKFILKITVSKVASARKIDLQIIYRSGNKELSHLEASRSVTPNKVIKDHINRDNGLYFGLRDLHLAEALFKLDNDDLNPFHRIFHSENISTPNHHKASFIRSTYFTPRKSKQTVVEEIKALQSVDFESC